jgi:hypothetical protein
LKWSYEFRRIKFTLSKKKREKLLQALSKYNDDLQKLMGSSDRLAVSRQRRKAPLTKFFQRVRNHAYFVHRVLASGWQCKCWSSHTANLLLQDRTIGDPKTKSKYPELQEIQFNILFQSGMTQTEVQQLIPWMWQESEIKLLEDLSHQEMAQSSSGSNTPRSPGQGIHGPSAISNALVPTYKG